jgi:hypothetical protein
MSAQPPPRPRRATLQPRFTLSLLYLFVFFMLYCLLLVSPALFEVARTLPPGPEQQETAREVAKQAIQPRLWMAGLAAVVTTGLGLYAGVLPGTRSKD